MENINDTLSKIDIDKICFNENLKKIIYCLMNEIERLTKENKGLKEEIQRLRDEIARLKGHSLKPEIPASKRNSNIEIPERRRENSNKGDREVNKTVRIDRREKIEPER